MTRNDALAFRKLVELGSGSLDDKTVSTAPGVLPQMKYDGCLIENKTRINWNGAIKRAAVDLYDTEANNPDNAPILWEDVLYRNGIRIIPEVITVGLSFAEGELGWWKGKLYMSIINNNTYTPKQHPDGWEEIK